MPVGSASTREMRMVLPVTRPSLHHGLDGAGDRMRRPRNPTACRRTLILTASHRGRAVPEPTPIFTIGYEKRSVDDLIWLLQSRQVARVIDVRLSPWSRRPDFSKKRLCAALEVAGIAYEHMGGLGNPPAIREIYLAGDAQAGHRRFREHLMNGAGGAVDELVEIAGRETVTLLCLERDAYRCHRSVVAIVAAERSSGERSIYHL
jgi:hypothetical protein